MEQSEQIKKVNDYFQKNMGINYEELLGYLAVLKSSVSVNMNVKLDDSFSRYHLVKIRKGTTIKIVGPKMSSSQLFVSITSLNIKIVNAQVKLGKLAVNTEMLIDAIK
jgi:hypothetical protein